MQNFTSIGKAPSEKSVTIHKKFKSHNKLSIPPYSTYGEIITVISNDDDNDICSNSTDNNVSSSNSNNSATQHKYL